MLSQLKRSLIITVLFTNCIVGLAMGQTFSITAFNGEKKTVAVTPISEKGILSIISSKDTINLKEVYTLEKVGLLNKNFLLVTCSVRAGSGMRLERTLIICAKGNGICESLRISSLFREDFLDFSEPVKSPIKVSVKTRYKVRFALTGNNANNYKLHAKIQAERKSVKKRDGDYSYSLIAELKFDTKQNIFYSDQKYLAQTFSVFSSKTNIKNNQYIKGTFPMVELGDYRYYYIKGEWHESDLPNNLSH